MTRDDKIALIDWAREGLAAMVKNTTNENNSEQDCKDFLTGAANFATIMLAMHKDL